MTGSNSFRVIPGRRSGTVGKLWGLSHEIVLIGAAQEQSLAISKIKVELRDIDIVFRRRARVKAIAGSVCQIADGRIIRGIATGRILQQRNC